MGVGNHHHAQSDIVMASSDDRILMDNYHHNRNPFIHNNPPGPASTQINSDIHQDIHISNRNKSHC